MRVLKLKHFVDIKSFRLICITMGILMALTLSALSWGCSSQKLETSSEGSQASSTNVMEVEDKHDDGSRTVTPTVKDQAVEDSQSDAEQIDIDIVEDYRKSFVHGKKDARYQKYIMIHDTEGDGSPQSVVNYWDGNGSLVAAHFVIGKDGTIVQCVPLDKIAHHAGYGDSGHNELYEIVEDGRDDMKGTVPIGSAMSDYGMNAWSIGIELVHVGASGKDYPKAQLEALDKVIAYIDAHYGFESKIIDHKSWRTGNSDTSKEFAKYMENYKKNRSYK